MRNPMQTPSLNFWFAILSGLIFSALYLFGNVSQFPLRMNQQAVHDALLIAVFMPCALHVWQRWMTKECVQTLLSPDAQAQYWQREWYAYLCWIIPIAEILGQPPGYVSFALQLLCFLLLQALAFFSLLPPEPRKQLLRSEKYIAILFLVSGFSALIYQVVWQRVLFATFGINTEAVTVIVSVFMFGLGVGALAGGWLQRRFQQHLLALFITLELLIGLFGLISLQLISWVGQHTSTTSGVQLLFSTWLILAIPTLLMGATLPILVAYLQGYFRNLGKSVGLLYAFNTIGSALAAFATVKILFVVTGQQAAIWIAACCNLITAALIYHASRLLQQAPQAKGQNENTVSHNPQTERLPYWFVFFALAAIGYISLSQEIIWYRLLGFVTAGKPQVFGLLLTAFLCGIAAGSLRSKQICESGRDPFAWMVRALLLAVFCFYLALPFAAWGSMMLSKNTVLIMCYMLVGLLAYYTGGMLPMLIHLAVGDDKQAGQENDTMRMSRLYFANIIGATLGPMLTGFILLDQFSLEGNVVILSLVCVGFLLLMLLAVPRGWRWRMPYLVAALVMGVGASLLHKDLFDLYLEKMQYESPESSAFKYKLENRAGIITIQADKKDAIYGGGVYDGRFNTDPVDNSNLIDRAYIIATMHRAPRKVLEIGLSSGSWTRVMSNYQPIERLDVVEINRGYPDIIRHYPDIAQIFTHPKVHLHYDDGRRWLRNHPQEKFDLIVMNTTFHWRSNITNLLSVEFLQMAKARLNPGGVIYYNTTGSDDVVHTAAAVFKYVTGYRNFVAASESPFDMSPEQKQANLLAFKQADGSPLFERDAAHREKMQALAAYNWPDWRKKLENQRGLYVITDDNMATEFKTNR